MSSSTTILDVVFGSLVLLGLIGTIARAWFILPNRIRDIEERVKILENKEK